MHHKTRLHPKRLPGWLARPLVASAVGCLLLCTAACGPEDPLQEVRDLQASGRFEESLGPLRQLVASQPDDPEVQFRYGMALVRTGNSSLAVWSLREAAAHPDWAAVARMELAAGAIHTGNWANALEALNEILGEDPDNVPALTLRAEAELGRKKSPESAIADLDRVLELDADNLRALTLRTSALIMAGRIDEAEEALLTLEDSGQNAELGRAALGQLCVARAVFQAVREKLEDADASFAECLERYPNHATVMQQTLAFYDERGQPGRSVEILEAALEKNPAAMQFRSLLAQRYRQRGEIERAETLLREALDLPDSHQQAAVWTALTQHYMSLSDVAAAAESYGEAMALSDDPPEVAVLEYADLLARAGDHARAREVASGLANQEYRHLIEARIAYESHDPRAALTHLDTVLPHWPNNASARYYAARASEQLGDFERAVEEYRQALRSNASITEAGLRLAKLQAGMGDIESAWVAISHHYRAHPSDPKGIEFAVRLALTRGIESQLENLMRDLRPTPNWALALAVRVDDIAERLGPKAAIARVRTTRGVDPGKPQNSALLRALVVNLVAEGFHEDAEQTTRAALEAAPDSARFLEIRGLALEGRGALAEARAAYERALERNPREARALTGLGRLAEAAGAPAEAFEYYDRAGAIDPDDPEPWRRAALLASRHGSAEEARERWRSYLREHPWESEPWLQLAQLRLEAGRIDEETVELGRRAVLLQGGAAARDLLAAVHDARGEPDLAREVRALPLGTSPSPAVAPNSPDPSVTQGPEVPTHNKGSG